MTGINKEVKKILTKPIWGVAVGGTTLKELRLTEETKDVIARQICQLFPQPLDGASIKFPEATRLERERVMKELEKHCPHIFTSDHIIRKRECYLCREIIRIGKEGK